MRTLLVEHTKQTHEDLHAHPRMVPLMQDNLSHPWYAALLTDYHAFYSAVESTRKAEGWHTELSLARQISSLQADLAARNEPTSALNAYSPHLNNQFECLGALYVLIGAQFGGHIIGTQIKATLPEASCQYFSRHDDDISQWRKLLASLEALPEHGPARAATLAGAKRTFEDFGQFLSEGLHVGA